MSVTASSNNKALMRHMYEEMWNKGDPTAAHIFFAEPTGVERFVGEFLQAFPDLQHKIEENLAEGDKVVVRFSAQGTHQST